MINHVPPEMDELRLQRIDMKKTFPQILALIACALLTACGAGNNCVGHNGCSDSSATTSTSSTTSTTYTIGGTISGLTSSSLVLQNNSGNALTISANSSTFVFTTALASGATYAVTVGTQPTGFTCTVTNGSGTVASANVTNVAVACTATTTTTGVVSILAGASAFHGFADGTGAAAKFNGPIGLVVDSSGNVYVADNGNNRIRKITSAGVVTTFAGSATLGTANGTGTAATFSRPNAITIDSSGNLYVVDANGLAATQIRQITPAGVVTSFAGLVGVAGSTEGTGTAARFSYISGIAIDSSNNLYVTDTNNFKIRKITSAGVVTTFAGSGTTGTVNGTGTGASFQNIGAITVDSSGNLYVVEQTAQTIRKITPAGVVTTLAGSGTSAYVDGTGTAASFQLITGITVDSSGNLYVTESGGGNTIRQITPAGVVTTFAGLKNDEGGIDVNGTLTAARFQQPYGITIDSSNNLYVSEFQFGFQNNIRKIVFTTTTQ
jgi:sugar lactone lactonase YvrE